MSASAFDRVYPPTLKPGFVKEHLRFWSVLGRMLLTRKPTSQVWVYFIIQAPRFVRKWLWQRYLSRDPAFRPPPLSEQGRTLLEALRRDGIVKVPRTFPELAEYVRDRYLADDSKLAADSPLTKHGLIVNRSISLSDQRIHDVLFDPEICAVICNYYGRQAYYRDNPTVLRERWQQGSVAPISGVFHSDGYRQISYMLILSDSTTADTHMELARGSHAEQQRSYDRTQIDQEAVLREFTLAHVVGPAGTLFIFDTEALHRGTRYLGTGRELLHVNITTGIIPFTNEKYSSEDRIFAEPSRVPAYVRQFVAPAIQSSHPPPVTARRPPAGWPGTLRSSRR